jgi:hypothetical protein
MMTLIRAEIAPILAALLIGIVTGWWMFRHRRADASDSTTPPAGTDRA